MRYDTIIVGAGMAGLTAAAYLCKDGYRVLLCDKEHRVGGLVNTFERDGFRYDGGIRALEDSGVLSPMLRQLGIEVPLIKSHVSLGIEDDIIHLDRADAVDEYRRLLERHFPSHVDETGRIIDEVKRIMGYMDVLYGIDNPAFVDLATDRAYLFNTLIPWLVRFPLTMRKIAKRNAPVYEYLARFTSNRKLLDFIAQHFFRKIPAFFALSYFRLYLDYHYPAGGTGVLPETISSFASEHGLETALDTEIVSIDPEGHTVCDAAGTTRSYRMLLWAADAKQLYRAVHLDGVMNRRDRKAIERVASELSPLRGGDSVFTLYLGVSRDVSFFRDISHGHFFYTPTDTGLSVVDRSTLDSLIAERHRGERPDPETVRSVLRRWLKEYFAANTFEISIPSIRDPSMSPPGKTGLVISTLFDYDVIELAASIDWYDELKRECEGAIIEVLSGSVYPGIERAIVQRFSATPMTIARRAGTADGAITGWAFTNPVMPAERRFLKIFGSTRTPIPDVVQAGQWTFSPSGFPIAVLTGKLAADNIAKQLG